MVKLHSIIAWGDSGAVKKDGNMMKKFFHLRELRRPPTEMDYLGKHSDTSRKKETNETGLSLVAKWGVKSEGGPRKPPLSVAAYYKVDLGWDSNHISR